MGDRPCTDAEQNEMSAFVKVLREAIVELEKKVILSLRGPPSLKVHPCSLEPFLSPQGLSFSWNFLLTEPPLLLTEPASPHENSYLTKLPSGQRVPQLLGSLASQIPPSSHERHLFRIPFPSPSGTLHLSF